MTGTKLSFKLRLKAWWEGYDAAEMEARLRALAEAEAAANAAKKEPEKPKLNVTEGPAVERPSERAGHGPEEDILQWTEARLDLAQYIWGKGFCGPGGPEHVVAISKLLALSPEMSVVEIGAELGGRCRVLAEHFGAWMTGYEESAALAMKATELSHMAGLERKAPVNKYDPENCQQFERKYDRALAKEALFAVENKQNLLKLVFKHLKTDALMLITDYVARDEDALTSPAIREWVKGEHYRPKPVSAADLSNMAKQAGFVVRVNEDITAQYIELISSAWAGADKVVATLLENGEQRLIDTLLVEAEFWNRRVRLMKSGELRVTRILGYKKPDPTAKLTNDW